MKRPRRRNRSDHPLTAKLTSSLAILAVVVVPLYVSPAGDESFRLPKLLALRTFGIAITILLVLRWLQSRPVDISRPLRIFLLSMTMIAIVTSAFSTFRMTSVRSSLTIASCVAMGLAAYDLAKHRADHRALWYVIAPAVVNSILVILQYLEIWNPFLGQATDENQLHLLSRSALQGNTNDLAGLLVLPILASLVLVRIGGSQTKLIAVLSLVAMSVGFVIASNVTASFALVGSGVVLFSSGSRRGLLSTLVVLLLLASLGPAIPPVKDRIARMKAQISQGGVDGLLSGRLIAFDAAILAFRDHPLTGVGPGRFAGEFFHYRNEAISRFGQTRYYEPSLMRNYGEVHNDYLQLLAETGITGFLLFVAFMLFVARSSLSSRGESGIRVALAFGAPAVVSLALLSLAHFPLQLPASLVTYSFSFGVILGWSERDFD